MQELPESLILETADRLGASSVPVEAIQNLWQQAMKSEYQWGCLNHEAGQKLWIAYRLREMRCFAVGCQSGEEIGTGCYLHCFDIYSDTRNLTDEEFAEFMATRKRYRDNEASVAATKLWKLLDSHPVNATADRAHYFNRDSKKDQ